MDNNDNCAVQLQGRLGSLIYAVIKKNKLKHNCRCNNLLVNLAVVSALR